MRRGAWIAGLALVLYLAGVAIQVRSDRRSVREVFPPSSVYNTAGPGLSLAYAYLQAKAPGRVEVLRRRVDPEELPARGVVFRVRPTMAPLLLAEDGEEEEEKEKDQKDGKDGKDRKKKKDEDPGERRRPPLLTELEEAWVRGGGRLVLAIDGWYGPVELGPIQGAAPVRKVFPLWPGVSKLAPAHPWALAGPPLATGHAVFLAGEAPIVARLPLGAGEVILLSLPEIFENESLGKAQHLALLEGLAGVAEKRPVRFDERAHGLGEDAGVTETLASWGFGPLLVLAGCAALLAGWRAAVRLGPPDRDDRDDSERRSDAVELLDSLADLYDRALRRGDAIRLYHESFVHAVAAETGLRGPALAARAHDLLERSSAGKGWEPPAAEEDLPRDRFERALGTLNQAFRRLQDAKRK